MFLIFKLRLNLDTYGARNHTSVRYILGFLAKNGDGCPLDPVGYFRPGLGAELSEMGYSCRNVVSVSLMGRFAAMWFSEYPRKYPQIFWLLPDGREPGWMRNPVKSTPGGVFEQARTVLDC